MKRYIKNLIILPAIAGLSLISATAKAQDFFGPRVFLGTGAGFMSAYNGGGGQIYGNSPNQWAWEEFELLDLNGGDIVSGDIVAFRTAVSRQFVSDNGGGVPATADRSLAYGWELFQVIRLAGPGVLHNGERFALKGWHGQYLGPNYNYIDAKVGCWFPGIGSWETLTFWDKHDRSDTRGNCVLYARSRVPLLPTGMSDLAGKKRGINSYSPSPGSVAIMNVGSVGHVGVVEQVHPDGTITIREANYIAGQVGSRRGTPSALRILGYYRP